MNTQEQTEKKDFTQAKAVLNDLKQYVEGKIARKSQANTQNVEVPAMTLASQPVIPNDHLTEEASLAPFDEATVNAVQSENASISSTPMPAETAVIDTTLTANNSPVPEMATTEYVQSSPASVGMATTETIQGTSAVPDVQTATQVIPSGEAKEGEALGSSSVAPVENMGPQVGGSEVLVQPTPIPESMTGVAVEPTPQPVIGEQLGSVPPQMTSSESVVADTSTAMNQGDTINAQNSMQQAGEAIAVQPPIPTPAPEPEPIATTAVNNGPELISAGIPSTPQENTGVDQQQAASIASTSEVSSPIPGMEAIPDIVMPSATETVGGETQSEAYQASSAGAQAEIADVTPAVSDTNVIMPEGTTAEIANDQTLVVGPEAFSPSR